MEQEEKLGTGLKVVLIIQTVLSVIGLVLAIGYVINFEATTQQLIEANAMLKESGMENLVQEIPTITYYYISLGLSIATIVGLVLLFLKSQLGVFIYFGEVVLSVAYTFIVSGFSVLVLVSVLFSLIFPMIIGILVYKQKYLFGFEDEDMMA